MTVPSVSRRQVLGLVPAGTLFTFVHCALATLTPARKNTNKMPSFDTNLTVIEKLSNMRMGCALQ
jgi:hypothetical protein